MKNIYYALGLLGFLVSTKLVLATAVKIDNPLGNINSIPDLISAILGAIVAIGAPIAVLFLIYAGFMFVTARGNDTRLAKAKETLMWTIVGIVILLGAELLSEVVKGTIEQLGVDVIR